MWRTRHMRRMKAHAGFALTRQMPHIGAVRIVERGQHVVQLDLGGKAPYEPLAGVQNSLLLLLRAFAQLGNTWLACAKNLICLAPAGTPFQRKVWNALRQIPYGQTRSYRQIAEAVNSPRVSALWAWPTTVIPLPCLFPVTVLSARTAAC